MDSIFTFLPDSSADGSELQRPSAAAAHHTALGAASPLWLMFGGAAAVGATYWWWANRWREAVNLEALMALTPEPVAPPVESVAILEASPEQELEAATQPVIETVAQAAEATGAVLDAAQDLAETVAKPAVETVVAANEDLAEATVEAVETVEAVDPIVAEVVAEVLAKAGETADDLTRLIGIGPRLAASLAEMGVTKFSQIAAWTPDELASFDQRLNLKGRAEREGWIAQAQRFSASA